MAELNEEQRWSLVLARHISGSLSVAASSVIVYQICLRYVASQKRSASTSSNGLVSSYHRLMLGFSIADILYSFWVGISTLAVPASSGVIYGFGNTLTCSTQGFFMQFAVATHLYSAALSTHFLLKIRYNVSDDVLYRRWELWYHLVPWSAAVLTGATGVALSLFNPLLLPELGCWLSPTPATCLLPEGPVCRGYKIKELATVYPFVFAYLWLFASFFVILVNNVLIYQAIRHQERRNSQYLSARLQQGVKPNARRTFGFLSRPTTGQATADTVPVQDNQSLANIDVSHTAHAKQTAEDVTSNPTESQLVTPNRDCLTHQPTSAQNRIKASRVAATQSVLYVSTAFFTAVWVFLPFFVYLLRLPNTWRYFFSFMCCAFVPLQGLFNLMIFTRLDYLRLQSKNRNWSRFQCAKTCMLFPELE